MRIRIRCRDNYHNNCNWLKWQGLSRMFQNNRWRVIWAEIGRSGSYADPPKHCWGDASRPPNGPAAVARGSGREARPEPAAAPDSRCTTSGCSAPAGEPRGR